MSHNRKHRLGKLFSDPLSGPSPEYSENGKTAEAPIPLSFDRVNEGQPFASNFILADLPIELTWQIVRQFAAITFDYSNEALELLQHLRKEAHERLLNHGQTKKPSLGACVRHVKVRNNSWLFMPGEDNEPLLNPSFRIENNPNEKEHNTSLEKGSDNYFYRYIPGIWSILSDPKVLPHIDFIDWSDQCAVDKETLKTIFMSRAKDISLRCVNLDEDLTLNLLPAQRRSPIRSLCLGTEWSSSAEPEGQSSPLLCQILDFLGPGLESLAWCGFSSSGTKPIMFDNDIGTRLSFPSLQNLQIHNRINLDPAFLGALIASDKRSPIRCLDIDTASDAATKEFFRTCGTLPHLEIFVWRCRGKEKLELSFLKQNSQLRKLWIDGFIAPEILDHMILPLLSRSFHNLTSLTLAWRDNTISEEALAPISTLSSLEKLYLNAGTESKLGIWEWVVDHRILQTYLTSLSRLQKLVLKGDTYEVVQGLDDERSHPMFYYEFQLPRTYQAIMQAANEGAFPFEDFHACAEKAWEEEHRQDMAAIADEYIPLLPNLDWLYFGQLPMQIKQGGDGVKRVVLLSEERVDGSPHLQRIFGHENERSFWYNVNDWKSHATAWERKRQKYRADLYASGPATSQF